MSSYLLDTNVLLRALDDSSPHRPVAEAAVATLLGRGDDCFLTAQVLIEFWAVATRPIEANGLGWALPVAEAQLKKLRTRFLWLEERADRLPSEHEYVICGRPAAPQRYLLAEKMYGIFKRMEKIEVLEKSLKTNLLFFRTSNSELWDQLDPELRRDIEEFCKGKVRDIIQRLQPHLIIAEGMETYDWVQGQFFERAEDKECFSDHAGRIYCCCHTPNGSPRSLIGMVHPTGTRTSWRFDQNREEIAIRLARDIDDAAQYSQ